MAKAAPWVKFFSADFLNGVADLEADEIGIYTVILALIWDRGQPIPDDPQWLARRAGTSTRRFNAVRKRLIELGKLEARAGMLGNSRALAAVEERDTRASQTRAAALARWHGHKEPELPLGDDQEAPKKDEKKSRFSPEQNDLISPKSAQKSQKPANGAMQTHDSLSRARATPEDSESRESNITTAVIENRASALDPLEVSNHLTRIAGVRNVDPARIIANQNITREWLNLGVPIPDLERMIIDARDHASGPIFSLKYFDPPVRQAQARKDYPNERSHSDPSRIADPLLREYVSRGGSLG